MSCFSEDKLESEILTVNGKEYVLLRLLGKGKGGYSYLTEKDGREYVVKQIHHEKCDYYQFGDKLASELRDYERLKAIGIPMPELLDADAENERIVKEYIPGDTVFELVCQGKDTTALAEQVRDMCRRLYPAHINIDYFPTNFIPRDGVLYYIDYECSDYTDEWNFENWGSKYWSQTKEFAEHCRQLAHGIG